MVDYNLSTFTACLTLIPISVTVALIIPGVSDHSIIIFSLPMVCHS